MRVLLLIDGRSVTLTTDSTLGRDARCDVVLADRSVSRRHATIVLSASSPRIRDLESRNGTWVNGVRITSERRLRSGDRVRLGAASLTVVQTPGADLDRDDAWLTREASWLLEAAAAGRDREVGESLFRIAEALEARLAFDERFGTEATEAALDAVVAYATPRNRPGWIRWAAGIREKLEEIPCFSGTLPIAADAGRRVG